MTLEEIKRSVLKLAPEYPIKRVILFGSRANGKQREDSDVDLIVEFSEAVSLLTLSQIKYRLEEMLNLSVDIVHGPLRSDDLLEVGEEVELYVA